jgi:23S rRNA (guanosine2251-2'-O)-methyltransferase
LARRGSYVYRDLGALLDDLAGLNEPALLVAADSLTDPMNLGNLCRSAFAAGAHGIIIPKDRAAGVTPVVIKAAAGALEYLPVYRVTNLADCLGNLRDAGSPLSHRCRCPGDEITDLTQPLILVSARRHNALGCGSDLVASIPMAARRSVRQTPPPCQALSEARRRSPECTAPGFLNEFF